MSNLNVISSTENVLRGVYKAVSGFLYDNRDDCFALMALILGFIIFRYAEKTGWDAFVTKVESFKDRFFNLMPGKKG